MSRFKTIENILVNFNENLSSLSKAKSEKFQFLVEKVKNLKRLVFYVVFIKLKIMEQILEEETHKRSKNGKFLYIHQYFRISLCKENDAVNKITLLEKRSKKTFEIFAKVTIFPVKGLLRILLGKT